MDTNFANHKSKPQSSFAKIRVHSRLKNLQPKKHMKPTPSILAIASIALLTASCGKKTETTVDMPASEVAAEATPATTDTYPLTTCVVSGEKLGDMGEPHVIVHEGTTVKFCCKACLKDFNEDPAKYITMIKEAEKK
jgi:YHS domain-containing protein